jgi:hypothetical protein
MTIKRVELHIQITRADGTIEPSKLAAVYDIDDENTDGASGHIEIIKEEGEPDESSC